MIVLFCQYCGRRFSTSDLSRRFCSRTCSIALRASSPAPPDRPVRRQAEILEFLRRHRGRFVALGTVAFSLYGADDADARHAAYNAVCRLRTTWADRGVRIEFDGRPTVKDWSVLRLRLVSDLEPEASEEAS